MTRPVFSPALCIGCVFPISAICTSCWFFLNPSSMVPRVLITICTTLVLALHILLISIFRSLYLPSFSASLNMILSPGITTMVSRHCFFLQWTTKAGCFAEMVWSICTATSHVIMVSSILITAVNIHTISQALVLQAPCRSTSANRWLCCCAACCYYYIIRPQINFIFLKQLKSDS